MIGGLGLPEILILSVVVVLMFGTRRLPELGSGLGKAISNFKKGYRESEAIDITPGDDSDDAKDKKEAKSE
jgi:sec-independent protein translocase protein TatA